MPYSEKQKLIPSNINYTNKDFSTIKDELVDICKNELSAIELTSRIIMLSEFPHATYGKIQKNKIKSWLIKNPNSTLTKIIPNETITELGDFLPSDIVSQSDEALSIKYNTEVYEKQRRGEDVIVLSLGEAFFDLPLFSFDDLPYPKINHYSHSRGIPELRQKLSKYFFETYDVSYDYEKEILITAGSKIAIYMCLMAILNPKDELLKKNYSILLLSLQRYMKAWELFDGRLGLDEFKLKNNYIHNIKEKLWLGAKLNSNNKILIVKEQGVGDEILPKVC